MPITKTPMRPVLVEYVCDHCGQGKMVRKKNSNVYYTDPPQYDYECQLSRYAPPAEQCPDKRLYGEFPRIEYASVEVGEVLD